MPDYENEVDEVAMKKENRFTAILIISVSLLLFGVMFGREVYKRSHATPLDPSSKLSIGDIYRVEGYTYEDKPIYFTNDLESPLVHRIYLPISVDIDGQKWYTYGVLAEYDGKLATYVDYGTGLLQSRYTSDKDEVIVQTMKTSTAQNSMYKYKLVEVIESINAETAFNNWCKMNDIDTDYIIAYGLR